MKQKDGPFYYRGAGFKYMFNGRPSSQHWDSWGIAAARYIEAMRGTKYGPLLQGKTFGECCKILDIKR